MEGAILQIEKWELDVEETGKSQSESAARGGRERAGTERAQGRLDYLVLSVGVWSIAAVTQCWLLFTTTNVTPNSPSGSFIIHVGPIQEQKMGCADCTAHTLIPALTIPATGRYWVSALSKYRRRAGILKYWYTRPLLPPVIHTQTAAF